MNIPQEKIPDITKIKKRHRPKIRATYAITQACDTLELIQGIFNELHQIATKGEDPKVKCLAGQTFAKLTEAWCALVDTRRELLGKPKVGTLRPDLAPARAGRARTIMVHDVQQPGNTCLDLIPAPPPEQNMVSQEPSIAQAPDDQWQRS